jgi:uncharacterized protein YndB with AHSA1/START domain
MSFDRTIAAPVEQVWAAMTDINRYAERFANVDAAVVLTEEPFGVGTRWSETRTVFGRSATLEIRVSESEALRRYLTEARVGARATTEFVFTPSTDGTCTRATMPSRRRAVRPGWSSGTPAGRPCGT